MDKKRSAPEKRALILALLVGAALLLLSARLVQLQAVEHGYWLERARAIQESTIEVLPRRGTIYDRNSLPLATDVKAVAIAVDSYNMTKPETLLTILHEELGLSRMLLRERIYTQSYFTWIDRSADLEAAQRIQQRVWEADARGLIFIDTWERSYPQGDLASNVLGIVGVDGDGLEGIELAHDGALAGTPTRIHVVEGADGRTYHTETVQEGTPGQDLTLTLDARLQFLCEEAIDRGVERFRADAGLFILIDPNTGDVLAMAQDRRVDLNDFGASNAEDRRNLAVGFLFEPGSSFKAFTGLAALEHGVVAVGDRFNGDDGIRVTGHVMHNAEYLSYGSVTFGEIIEKSINTGMIQVAQRLGAEPFHQILAALGFGEKTGVGLPGEENGILRDADDWSPLDLAAAAIGQSVAVTGIQLARGMAAIANGGFLVTSRIVQSSVGSETPPGVPGEDHRVVSKESCATMRTLLRRVIGPEGTGPLAEVDGYEVAGKTGTAQKAIPGRGYAEGKYTSVFAGFLPQEDSNYLGVVVLDEVKTQPVWGGYTAGQIFSDALSRIVRIEHVPPVAAH